MFNFQFMELELTFKHKKAYHPPIFWYIICKSHILIIFWRTFNIVRAKKPRVAQCQNHKRDNYIYPDLYPQLNKNEQLHHVGHSLLCVGQDQDLSFHSFHFGFTLFGSNDTLYFRFVCFDDCFSGISSSTDSVGSYNVRISLVVISYLLPFCLF